MKCRHHVSTLAILVLLVVGEGIPAQSSGASGGRKLPRNLSALEDRSPRNENVERYIAISGSAEIRVAPTALRIVFAVTAEGVTGTECQASIEKQLATLRKTLEAEGIAAEHIVEDFIALLPAYSWDVDELGGTRVAREKRSGYVLQHNAHVRVKTEQEAQRAIGAALKVGLGDILTIDHWSEDLNAAKVEAQGKALVEARRKATLLLEAVFDEKPRPINVHEQTGVVFPQDLYVSFENEYVTQFRQQSYENRLPTVAMFKPKNTFLVALSQPIDVQAKALPMKPEISVVSTVTLYFEPPITRTAKTPDKPR